MTQPTCSACGYSMGLEDEVMHLRAANAALLEALKVQTASVDRLANLFENVSIKADFRPPSHCRDKSSCARHGRCMYLGCGV